jgi:HD-GYP domain-containing protein (c-di-GMP phosphodiesterase class II)
MEFSIDNKGGITLKAVLVEDLKPGMTLARTIINNDMVVVLSENTLLTKAHITRLGFLDIPTVYVKDEYELSSNYQNVAAMFNPSNAFVTEYKEVIYTAQEIFDAAAKEGKAPVKKAETLVRESLVPMAQQSGVIDYLLELNHLATDVYNHSLRVSILSGVIGKWIHYEKEKIQDLILAGFLHDIGKTKFTERLLEKQVEFLKGEDLEAYMQHTMEGHHILSANPELSEGVKLTPLQHHERMDGSGFPFNSTGKDIHEYARVIAVADIYDNITTEREGCKKETPFAAISRITADMYTKLDPNVCVPFLTHIKEAFLGSRVALSNGLQGTIVRYTNDYAAEPMIRVSQDTIIDLNTQKDITIIEYNPK